MSSVATQGWEVPSKVADFALLAATQRQEAEKACTIKMAYDVM